MTITTVPDPYGSFVYNFDPPNFSLDTPFKVKVLKYQKGLLKLQKCTAKLTLKIRIRIQNFENAGSGSVSGSVYKYTDPQHWLKVCRV